jgi:hypothetical protein
LTSAAILFLWYLHYQYFNTKIVANVPTRLLAAELMIAIPIFQSYPKGEIAGSILFP